MTSIDRDVILAKMEAIVVELRALRDAAANNTKLPKEVANVLQRTVSDAEQANAALRHDAT
jgi:hypothetical protein